MHSIFSTVGMFICFFFFQAEDGIRDDLVTEFRRVLFRSCERAGRLDSFSDALKLVCPLCYFPLSSSAQTTRRSSRLIKGRGRPHYPSCYGKQSRAIRRLKRRGKAGKRRSRYRPRSRRCPIRNLLCSISASAVRVPSPGTRIATLPTSVSASRKIFHTQASCA